VITRITPVAVANIGWRTFIMFGVFCLAMTLFVIFFIPETKQMKLEDMDILFGTVDAAQRAQDVEAALAVERKEAALEHRENSVSDEPKN
jgi:sensor domain CHASE-containing protein